VGEGGVGGGWGAELIVGLPPFSTGFVNGHALAGIFSIAMDGTPYGAQLAHRVNRWQLEMGFAVFLLFLSVRLFWSLVG
jgi:uncharacterized protein